MILTVGDSRDDVGHGSTADAPAADAAAPQDDARAGPRAEPARASGVRPALPAPLQARLSAALSGRLKQQPLNDGASQVVMEQPTSFARAPPPEAPESEQAPMASLRARLLQLPAGAPLAARLAQQPLAHASGSQPGPQPPVHGAAPQPPMRGAAAQRPDRVSVRSFVEGDSNMHSAQQSRSPPAPSPYAPPRGFNDAPPMMPPHMLHPPGPQPPLQQQHQQTFAPPTGSLPLFPRHPPPHHAPPHHMPPRYPMPHNHNAPPPHPPQNHALPHAQRAQAQPHMMPRGSYPHPHPSQHPRPYFGPGFRDSGNY